MGFSRSPTHPCDPEPEYVQEPGTAWLSHGGWDSWAAIFQCCTPEPSFTSHALISLCELVRRKLLVPLAELGLAPAAQAQSWIPYFFLPLQPCLPQGPEGRVGLAQGASI